ncbi:hypothetical protein PIB30_011518 [Stylosanthes scabra]|uniref:Uncharacterized protein n=1 Tax=Stylosanthes scabra TaxID=79078 RepID=A0ABU6T687_9FABA|nr:hypothetical protein [Stylosanthes scabra]
MGAKVQRGNIVAEDHQLSSFSTKPLLSLSKPQTLQAKKEHAVISPSLPLGFLLPFSLLSTPD